MMLVTANFGHGDHDFVLNPRYVIGARCGSDDVGWCSVMVDQIGWIEVKMPLTPFWRELTKQSPEVLVQPDKGDDVI